MNCTYPNHPTLSTIPQERSLSSWDITVSNSILPGINWTVCTPCIEHLVKNIPGTDITMTVKGLPL